MATIERGWPLMGITEADDEIARLRDKILILESQLLTATTAYDALSELYRDAINMLGGKINGHER